MTETMTSKKAAEALAKKEMARQGRELHLMPRQEKLKVGVDMENCTISPVIQLKSRKREVTSKSCCLVCK